MEEGIGQLCETLAIAFAPAAEAAEPVKGKYDALVANAVISAEELELATRSARRKNLDVETVLIDEFQVKPSAIGEALANFFGVPYEPFKPDRIKPLDLLKNLKREFLESSVWVPIEDTKEGMVVLTTDPEKLQGLADRQQRVPEGQDQSTASAAIASSPRRSTSSSARRRARWTANRSATCWPTCRRRARPATRRWRT